MKNLALSTSSLKLPAGLSLSTQFSTTPPPSNSSSQTGSETPNIPSELPSTEKNNSPPSPTSASQQQNQQSEDKHRDTVARVNKRLREYGPKDFEILRYIGRGGIGKVYCVRLKASRVNANNSASAPEKIFAMKVLNKLDMISKNKVKRVLTEREILATADHPFIVTLYCSFQTKNKLYYVMEYCSGGDFFRMLQLQPQKCISEKECQFYAAEVLSALEYLHYMGFIYRDLKPENILVAESGHIRLTDFDLSKSAYLKKNKPVFNKSNSNNNLSAAASSTSSSSTTNNNNSRSSSYFSTFLKLFQSKNSSSNSNNDAAKQQQIMLQQYSTNNAIIQTNSFVGTEEYLAPEVIEGVGHGASVDWWTFGILIYEMLFGKTPFKGASQRMTFGNIIMFYKQKKESKGLKLNLPKTTPRGEKLSKSCRNLIRALLDPDPNTRLGHDKDSVDVKNHPFFKGINWALLRTKKPPIVPQILKLDVPQAQMDSESDPLNDESDDCDTKGDANAEADFGCEYIGPEKYDAEIEQNP